jgi:hypothetical protein
MFGLQNVMIMAKIEILIVEERKELVNPYGQENFLIGMKH